MPAPTQPETGSDNVSPVSETERAQARGLRRMKATATGLLLLMTLVFACTYLVPETPVWLGYLRAFTEAAMVGALADWFAVTYAEAVAIMGEDDGVVVGAPGSGGGDGAVYVFAAARGVSPVLLTPGDAGSGKLPGMTPRAAEVPFLTLFASRFIP